MRSAHLLSLERTGMCYDDVPDKELSRRVILEQTIIGGGIQKV